MALLSLHAVGRCYLRDVWVLLTLKIGAPSTAAAFFQQRWSCGCGGRRWSCGLCMNIVLSSSGLSTAISHFVILSILQQLVVKPFFKVVKLACFSTNPSSLTLILGIFYHIRNWQLEWKKIKISCPSDFFNLIPNNFINF